MSFSSESPIPDYTFANNQGIKRTEGVFTVVDALDVDVSAGQSKGASIRTLQLRFPQNISKGSDRFVSQTLIERSTNSHVVIPQGSRIVDLTVDVNGSASLENKLALMFGVIQPSVQSKDAKKLLVGRFVSQAGPLTGALLNAHKSASYSCALNKDQASSLVAIYNNDALAQENEEEVLSLEYENLSASQVVGEPRPVVVCGTVIDGNLNADDLSIFVSYIAPACDF